MQQRFKDVIAEEASRSFVGRQGEIRALMKLVEGPGARVVYIHGIAGIGKSALLAAFVERARNRGIRTIALDCRAVEPTEQGFLRALGLALERDVGSVQQAMKKLTGGCGRTLLTLDHYELWRLLDSWLRQVFIPQLSKTVRLVLASREAPGAAWYSAPGWQRLVQTIELDALPDTDATELLLHAGIERSRALNINRVTRGNPLALTLAASTMTQQQDRIPENFSIQHVIAELAQFYLADIADSVTRRGLEAASVIRRATVPLLRAMLADSSPRKIFDQLQRLPFVHSEADGLHVHDCVKQAITAALRSADPARYHEYRRAALAELHSELSRTPAGELWRYTADLLYLLDNPVIREAFFPSQSRPYSVEPATKADEGAIEAICAHYEGRESAACLRRWWAVAPETFSAAYDHQGKIAGFYCLSERKSLSEQLIQADPVAKIWANHVRENPVPNCQTVLFLRRWLSDSAGEAPSAVQAACWLDIKRTYLALRPRLRRVYLTLNEITPYASVAKTLGFRPIENATCRLDGRNYYTAVLDFGPSSVDGWLAGLVAAELGVENRHVVDLEGRSLVVENQRVPLTRLEFAVIQYLHQRKGKAVARDCLIRDVWGHKYDVGSNVVDAVIKSVRKKLGKHADVVETVRGFGYTFRQHA